MLLMLQICLQQFCNAATQIVFSTPKPLREFVEKPAIIACMRKLLTMLNDMVRQNTVWDENKKGGASQTVSSPPATACVLDKI